MTSRATPPTRSNAADGSDGAQPPGSGVRLSLAIAAPRVEISQLERFLAACGAAGLAADDEILIAASPARESESGDLARWLADRASSREGELPELRYSLHPVATTPMRLWGFAMAPARGRYVAVLDARDALAEGWATAWWETSKHLRGAVVCGPVDPGNFEDFCSWAAYLAEYGRFWSHLKSRDFDELPGNNIVFPRALLPDADVLSQRGFWKTFHLEALQRSPSEDPDSPSPPQRASSAGMVVRVERRYGLSAYLRRRYLHGRCYGGSRLAQPGAPPRILCMGFCPLLPWLRTARVLRRLIGRSRAVEAGEELRSWPRGALGPLVLGEMAWSWGEFAGYARGTGTACEELW